MEGGGPATGVPARARAPGGPRGRGGGGAGGGGGGRAAAPPRPPPLPPPPGLPPCPAPLVLPQHQITLPRLPHHPTRLRPQPAPLTTRLPPYPAPLPPRGQGRIPVWSCEGNMNTKWLGQQRRGDAKVRKRTPGQERASKSFGAWNRVARWFGGPRP